MMKPVWIEIVPAVEHKEGEAWRVIHTPTYAMNVPGGCVINHAGSTMVFVPGMAVIKKDEEQGGEIGFVSTAQEEMEKAEKAINRLTQMFQSSMAMDMLSKKIRD